MLLTLSVLTSCGSGEHTLPTVDGAPSNSQMVAEQPANTAESDEDVSGGGLQTPPEMTGPVLDNESTETVFALLEVAAYNGEPYVAINGNTPYFTDDVSKAARFLRHRRRFAAFPLGRTCQNRLPAMMWKPQNRQNGECSTARRRTSPVGREEEDAETGLGRCPPSPPSETGRPLQRQEKGSLETAGFKLTFAHFCSAAPQR